MSGINSIFDVGTRSMAATKLAMNTSNHNIANANTQGYSKQRIDLTTAEPYRVGEAIIGDGVRVAGSSRGHSDFLQRRIIEESSVHGQFKAGAETLAEVEGIVNEALTEKMNAAFSEFFNSFRDLSTNPESEAVRRTVIENSRVLVRTIRGVNDQIAAMQDSIDFRIKDKVNRVNELVDQIAHLNGTIAMSIGQKLSPNDELDKRDLAVRELSHLIEVYTAVDEKGYIQVTAGNRLPLVNGVNGVKLTAISTVADQAGDGKKLEGAVDVFSISPSGTLKSARGAMTGGEIAGLIETRDDALVRLKDRLDEMTYAFTNAVNSVHRKGFGRDGFSGRNFFRDLSGGGVVVNKEGAVISSPTSRAGRPTHFDAMARFDLANSTASTDFLAAAMAPNAPGDNRVALAIANIERMPILANGQSTLADFYGSAVGEIGTLTKSKESFFQHHDDILRQLHRYRESLVGVSMDEEAANLVRLQQQFNASAKVIQTGNEMLDVVLNIKR